MFDVSTGQSTQFAKHDAPVKGLRWVEANIVATGSWDKTIKVKRGRILYILLLEYVLGDAQELLLVD